MRKLPRGGMSIREQIDHHQTYNTSQPFRPEFNAEDRQKFEQHAPGFLRAWDDPRADLSATIAAAGIAYDRLARAGGGKLSADGSYVREALGDMQHLLIATRSLQRQADDFAAAHVATATGGEQWRDRDGNPVRVLRPQDSALRPEDRACPYSLGQFLDAVVTGRNMDKFRNDLGTSPDSAGGYTVPAPISRELIDKLRAKSRLIAAGARTLQMEGKTQTLARVTADPAVTWRASENAGLSGTDPTFGALTLTAKTVAVLTKLSIELAQDSVNAQEAAVTSLTGAVALAIDKAALHGVANGPSGLIAVSGRTQVTSAGAPTWDSFITGMENLAAADVDLERCSQWIMSPRTWGDLQRLKTGLTNDNTPRAMPPAIANHKLHVTTSVLNTLGAGSDSVIFGGDFADVVLGVRQDITLRVLQERFMDSLSIGLLVYARVDVGVLRPASLLTIEGVTNV